MEINIWIDFKEYESLKELSKKMASQDNRATQNPIFWIKDKVKRYSFNNDYETVTWVEVKEDCYVCESCQDFYQANPDYEENPNCEKETDEWECEWSSWLVEYIEDYVIVYRPWFFLTQELAEQHIKQNSYHYNDPIVRCGSLWRNDSMIKVISTIFDITWVEKPHFYD